ncbi:hypothetical protein GC167_00145 [bacterium]|nr:hypothetical protein [bacterium]
MEVLKWGMLLLLMGGPRTIFSQNRVALFLTEEAVSGQWGGSVEYPAEEPPFRWSAEGCRVTRIEALGLGWSRTLSAETEMTPSPVALPEGTVSIRFSFEVPFGRSPSDGQGWGPGLGAWMIPKPRNQRAYPIELTVLCDTPCTVVWTTPVVMIGTEGKQQLWVLTPTEKALMGDLALRMVRKPWAVLAGHPADPREERPHDPKAEPVAAVAMAEVNPSTGSPKEPAHPVSIAEINRAAFLQTPQSDQDSGIAISIRGRRSTAEQLWNARDWFFQLDRAGNQGTAERAQALAQYRGLWSYGFPESTERPFYRQPNADTALWNTLDQGQLHPVLFVVQKARSNHLVLEWRCRNGPDGLEIPFVWKMGALEGRETFVVDDTAGIWTLTVEGIPDFARFDLVSGLPVECIEMRSGYSYLFDFQSSKTVVERIQAYSGLIQTAQSDLLRTACFVGLEDASASIRLMALQGLSEHPELDRTRFRSELDALKRNDPDPLIRELAAELSTAP